MQPHLLTSGAVTFYNKLQPQKDAFPLKLAGPETLFLKVLGCRSIAHLADLFASLQVVRS